MCTIAYFQINSNDIQCAYLFFLIGDIIYFEIFYVVFRDLFSISAARHPLRNQGLKVGKGTATRCTVITQCADSLCNMRRL